MATANALNMNTQLISGNVYPDLVAGSGITLNKSGGTTTIVSGGSGGFLAANNNLSDVSSASTSRNNLFKNSATTIGSLGTLPESVFGGEVYITANGGYQISLPSASSNPNGFIDFVFDIPYSTPYASSNNYVILYNPGGNFNGIVNTLIFATGDSMRLVSDGTNYWTVNYWMKPINFLTTLSLATDNSIPSNADTTAQYNNIIRNVGGGYNAADVRFFPPVPGLYEFYHLTSLTAGSLGGNSRMVVEIQDNFAAPITITGQMALMGNDVSYSPGVSNKININLTSTLNTSFGVVVSQASAITQELDVNHCFFGGSRISPF